MDGRSECEEIRDSREVFDLYSYIYIYLFYLSNLLIYSYSKTTLYHSVVSKNLFVFSMFDCL